MEFYITKRIYLRIYLVKNRKTSWKYHGWKRTTTSHYRGLHFEWNLGKVQFGIDFDKFHTLFGAYSATSMEYREKQFACIIKGLTMLLNILERPRLNPYRKLCMV